MEKKKITKLNLSTFFLILAIIVIVVMAIFMYKFYNEKTLEIQKIAELQAQISNLNETINDLQEKIDTLSNTINNDSTSNISGVSSTSSTSTIKTIKPSKKISKLLKNHTEAEDLITTGSSIDFYENEIPIGDNIWSFLSTDYKATSTHEKDTAEYNVSNLDNFFTDNCWCEGVSGNGVGEKIEVNTFASCEKVEHANFNSIKRSMKSLEDTIDYLLTDFNNDDGRTKNKEKITKDNISNYYSEVKQVAIINGNAKDDTLWKNNNRVKKLKLTIDNSLEYVLQLEDTKDLQLFDINYKNDNITKKINMKFEILEVYPGEKYDDTCLTSVYLSGGSNIQWGGR